MRRNCCRWQPSSPSNPGEAAVIATVPAGSGATTTCIDLQHPPPGAGPAAAGDRWSAGLEVAVLSSPAGRERRPAALPPAASPRPPRCRPRWRGEERRGREKGTHLCPTSAVGVTGAGLHLLPRGRQLRLRGQAHQARVAVHAADDAAHQPRVEGPWRRHRRHLLHLPSPPAGSRVNLVRGSRSVHGQGAGRQPRREVAPGYRVRRRLGAASLLPARGGTRPVHVPQPWRGTARRSPGRAAVPATASGRRSRRPRGRGEMQRRLVAEVKV